MSYTKQTWTTGDTVTATKLNHFRGLGRNKGNNINGLE